MPLDTLKSKFGSDMSGGAPDTANESAVEGEGELRAENEYLRERIARLEVQAQEDLRAKHEAETELDELREEFRRERLQLEEQIDSLARDVSYRSSLIEEQRDELRADFYQLQYDRDTKTHERDRRIQELERRLLDIKKLAQEGVRSPGFIGGNAQDKLKQILSKV